MQSSSVPGPTLLWSLGTKVRQSLTTNLQAVPACTLFRYIISDHTNPVKAVCMTRVQQG